MNQKVKWLVEADVFQDNTDKLIKTLKDNGYTYRILKYIPFDDDLPKRCLDLYGPGECVVFYGSLNFAHKLQKLNWTPGVYLNDKAFECTSYYPILGDMLVHSAYIMLPYGDLLRMKENLFKYIFKYQNKVFIRPNSGSKEFTGMIVEEDNFEECIKLAGFYDVEPNLLVLISNVLNLEKEWRFVVVDGKVISGSLYRDWSAPESSRPGIATRDYVLRHSHSKHEICKDKQALAAAQKCADRYNPDRCWTIDVAKTEMGTYAILEIGCFSCAGMYGNNLEKIVRLVSASALKEWEESYGPVE